MAKLSPLAVARAEATAVRRRQIDAGYRTHHPARAAAEAALRQQRAEVLREGQADYLGTPETRWHARRVAQGALARLYERGYISIHQLAWSQSIKVVHERIGRAVSVAGMSLETRVDGGRGADGVFFEKLGAVRAEVTYTRWRAQAKGVGLVLALVAEERSLAEVARAFHLRPASAREVLKDALDLWGDLNSAVCDEIDEAALLAAQAGLF